MSRNQVFKFPYLNIFRKLMDGNATMILIFFLLDETGTGTDLGHKTVTFSFGNRRFVTAWIHTYFVLFPGSRPTLRKKHRIWIRIKGTSGIQRRRRARTETSHNRYPVCIEGGRIRIQFRKSWSQSWIQIGDH